MEGYGMIQSLEFLGTHPEYGHLLKKLKTRDGAWATVRRGLRLSPELRRGLPGTIAIAIVATAGRVIVPIAIQQLIDRSIAAEGVDVAAAVQFTLIALAAVLVTAMATASIQRLCEQVDGHGRRRQRSYDLSLAGSAFCLGRCISSLRD